jgi:hypothetical protein
VALEAIWSWAKKEELNQLELLLAQSVEGVTALRIVVRVKYKDTLQKMWDWAEEAQLNSNELKNLLLLSKDIYGYTVWHRAAESGNLVALEILWIWAKKADLNQDKLSLAQNRVEKLPCNLQ